MENGLRLIQAEAGMDLARTAKGPYEDGSSGNPGTSVPPTHGMRQDIPCLEGREMG